MAIPDDPNTRLTRQQLSAALTEAGFPVAAATLSTKATRGGGPPFSHFGPRVSYRWGDALAWAQARLTPPVSSTAEATARASRAGQPEDVRRQDRRSTAETDNSPNRSARIGPAGGRSLMRPRSIDGRDQQ